MPVARLRRVLRGSIAPVLLALVTAGFCWKLVFGGLVVIGYDTMTYMYPYRFFAAEALKAGRVPLWNPHIFYGAPFLANLQSAVFYPFHVLFLALPATDAMNWSVVLHLFMCAWFAYLAARGTMGLDPLSSAVAGALYGLSGFVGAQVGHLNQLNAAAWLPLALLTLHHALTRHSPRWIGATAAVLGVQLLAGHAQESYMTIALLGTYAAFHVLWRTMGALRATPESAGDSPLPVGEGRGEGSTRGGKGSTERHEGSLSRRERLSLRLTAALRALLGESVWAGIALGVAGALAAGAAAVQLLPSSELTRYSIRANGMTFGEAASFSLPPRELFVGLLPTFGLAQPTSNEYLGWIGFAGLALMLFAILFQVHRPAVLFFFILALVSFMLALGNHFPVYEWAFRVPGVRLFRVPARWLMLTTLADAMLAGAGLAFVRRLGSRGWPTGTLAGSDAPAGPWQRLLASSRLLLALALVAVTCVALWPLQKPGPGTIPTELIGVWLALAGVVVALSFWALAVAPSRWPGALFAVMVLGELFYASRPLEYNNPNPPEVYADSRPVHEALRRTITSGDRYLSIAATGYHPSDAKQLVTGYEPLLGQNGVLATLINTKYKEILAPNLPMVYGFTSVDGYDGGVLPLRRYVDYKRLVVAPEQNVPDALLRDQLRQVPQVSRLRTLGATYVIADSINDVTNDGTYFDMSGALTLGPGESVRLAHIGLAQEVGRHGPISAIGIVSSLEGAGLYPDGAPVLAIALGSGGAPRSANSTGQVQATVLAGMHTAEGAYSPAVRHRQPAPLGPAGAGGSAQATYLARIPVSAGGAEWVTVESLLTSGRVRIYGLTLIGDGSAQWPVTLAADGALQLVHRSDVKLYRNAQPLPRAYVAPRAMLVEDLDRAIEALGRDGHQPESVAVLERAPFAPPPSDSLRGQGRRLMDAALELLGIERRAVPGAIEDQTRIAALTSGGQPAPDSRTLVDWVEDAPERVVLRVTAPAGGLLVLRDTYYPGWTATVDGQPADLLRADVLFRAVPLPAGSQTPHEVVLAFRSRPFERAVPISLLSLVLICVLCVLPYERVLARRRQRTTAASAGPAVER